jgi:hypothetical protein
MLFVTNKDADILIDVDTKLQVKENRRLLRFVQSMRNELEAKIIAEFIRELIARNLKKFAEENYTQGYKDGKSHKQRRNWHPGTF